MQEQSANRFEPDNNKKVPTNPPTIITNAFGRHSTHPKQSK